MKSLNVIELIKLYTVHKHFIKFHSVIWVVSRVKKNLVRNLWYDPTHHGCCVEDCKILEADTPEETNEELIINEILTMNMDHLKVISRRVSMILNWNFEQSMEEQFPALDDLIRIQPLIMKSKPRSDKKYYLIFMYVYISGAGGAIDPPCNPWQGAGQKPVLFYYQRK